MIIVKPKPNQKIGPWANTKILYLISHLYLDTVCLTVLTIKNFIFFLKLYGAGIVLSLSIEFVHSVHFCLRPTAMKMLSKVCVTLCLGIVSSLVSLERVNIPDGPQGPSGAILKVNFQKKQ